MAAVLLSSAYFLFGLDENFKLFDYLSSICAEFCVILLANYTKFAKMHTLLKLK